MHSVLKNPPRITDLPTDVPPSEHGGPSSGHTTEDYDSPTLRLRE